MPNRSFLFIALIAISSAAVAACAREVAPHPTRASSSPERAAAPTEREPVPPPVAPAVEVPAQQGTPAVPGTRAHMCPGIDQLDATLRPCAEAGCAEGFSIQLQPFRGWPPGRYRFVIAHDDATTTCEGTVPFARCEENSVRCDGDRARVGASGCALPASSHGFGEIRLEGYPVAVDVEIVRDDVPITRAHFDVDYQTVQPNGPGCTPACCSARLGRLTLPTVE